MVLVDSLSPDRPTPVKGEEVIVRKASTLLTIHVDRDRTTRSWGVEAGTVPDPRVVTVESIPDPPVLRPPDPDRVAQQAERARRLWHELQQLIGADQAQLQLVLSTADLREFPREVTDETARSRVVEVVQVGIGGRPGGRGSSIWRSLAPPTGADGWSAAVAESLARHAIDEVANLPRVEPPAPEEPLLLDRFVVADLLRHDSERWLVGGRLADQVGSRETGWSDPGDGRDSVDSFGIAQRPFVAVEKGVLVGLPSAGGTPTGSHLLGSWREGARLGWRRLTWSGASAADIQKRQAIVTRTLFLRSGWLASGVWSEAGLPISGWGPVLIPKLESWAHGVSGGVGSPLVDLGGVPVETPALQFFPQ